MKTPAVGPAPPREGIEPHQDRDLGQWERRSAPLRVTDRYRPRLRRFLSYFRAAARALGDESLRREERVLERLLAVGGESATAGDEMRAGGDGTVTRGNETATGGDGTATEIDERATESDVRATASDVRATAGDDDTATASGAAAAG